MVAVVPGPARTPLRVLETEELVVRSKHNRVEKKETGRGQGSKKAKEANAVLLRMQCSEDVAQTSLATRVCGLGRGGRSIASACLRTALPRVAPSPPRVATPARCAASSDGPFSAIAGNFTSSSSSHLRFSSRLARSNVEISSINYSIVRVISVETYYIVDPSG
jgi:hypothetical protein